MTDSSSRVAADGPARESGVLGRFLFLSWLLLLANGSRLLLEDRVQGPSAFAFSCDVLLTYSCLYMLPAVLPVAALHFLLGRGPGAALLRHLRIPPAWPARGAGVLLAAALQMLLLADAAIYRLYGFHFNGFVWNLVNTPGGIESMGADAATMWTAAGLFASFLAAEALLLLLSLRWTRLARTWEWWARPRPVLATILAWILLSGGERVAYGMSDVKDYRPVLRSAGVFPAYAPIRFRKFARSIGIESADREKIPALKPGTGALQYPLAPLRAAPGAPRWNVVVLVAESWRFDMLDPVIMPETTAFAARSLDFRNHYSGGNGTRMGIFSLFYGLYGPYWFPFLQERRSPVLMDFLLDGGWQLKARTSAKFTFPEFDRTVFARVPSADLTEGDPSKLGWENDRAEVGSLLADIDRRDPARPFFSFMFFESPHARYYFPEECALRRPYLEKVNYATMDPARDRDLLHARYVNSCRHLDTQFGRILRGLEERGLLDSTVVILTGDHGEEFMERGRWGHHSAFNRYQCGVPMILHHPGCVPARVEAMTSHLDIPATLLGLLGVENPASDYGLGVDLLRGGSRSSCVVSGWDDLAWRGASGTLVVPMGRTGLAETVALGPDDRELPEEGERAALSLAGDSIREVLSGLSRFRRKR